MKEYNLFDLYIIQIKEKIFICIAIIPGETYNEVFTNETINVEKNYKIEKLSNYLKSSVTYDIDKPIILSQEDILTIYLDFYKKQNNQTYLKTLISNLELDNESFYERIYAMLEPNERNYIKSLLKKSCSTCMNGTCRVPSHEKVGLDEFGNPQGSECISWKNNELICKYKVLHPNRKNNL